MEPFKRNLPRAAPEAKDENLLADIENTDDYREFGSMTLGQIRYINQEPNRLYRMAQIKSARNKSHWHKQAKRGKR